MSNYYTRAGEPMTLLEWTRTFGGEDNHVAYDTVDGVQVSTVWLGLDHSVGNGSPLIFETMIFGGPHDQWCNRYTTEEEARRFHADAVEALREGRDP